MTKYHQSFPILWKIHPNSVFFNESAEEVKDESTDSESSERERSDNDQATEVNSFKDEKGSLFVAAGIDETTIRGIFPTQREAQEGFHCRSENVGRQGGFHLSDRWCSSR
jgi:hypothetical protein